MLKKMNRIPSLIAYLCFKFCGAVPYSSTRIFFTQLIDNQHFAKKFGEVSILFRTVFPNFCYNQYD